MFPVTVVVPHFNDHENLFRLLEELAEQGADEVIVVDDGSPRRPYLRTDGVLMYVQGIERRGAAYRRNQGALLARNSNIAFIDSDMMPGKDWLKKGCKALDRYPVVAGAYVKKHFNGNPSLAQEYSKRFKNAVNYKQNRGASGNLFMRREVFAQTGGWSADQRLSEDIDFFDKLKRERVLFYLDKSLVAYHPTFTARQELRRIRRAAYRSKRAGESFERALCRSMPLPWTMVSVVWRADNWWQGIRFALWHVTYRIMFLWYWFKENPKEGPKW